MAWPLRCACDHYGNESLLPTPISIVEGFLMVMVLGFGGDWAAIWRQPALVKVVEVLSFRVKLVRKER